jgi:uncharacterized protein (TIGR02145 family)
MLRFFSTLVLLFGHYTSLVVSAQYSPTSETAGSGVEEGPCSGSTALTFDGHTYALVGIGTQCWFKENLRSDNYRNGDAIPGNLSDSLWTSTGSGAQAVYNNDPANLANYGRLYNWYAVKDVRGLCPVGFHVPTKDEWRTLRKASGDDVYSAAAGVAGTALKSSATDSPPWDGNNSSGFSALPGGSRYSWNGTFNNLGDYGYWWTSSPSESDAWAGFLGSGSSAAKQNYYRVRVGFSVRCVRD